MSNGEIKTLTDTLAQNVGAWQEVTGTDVPGDKRAVDVINRDPNVSLFGEQVVGTRTHAISTTFNYNLSTIDVTTDTSGTGTAVYDQSTLKVTSGTSVGVGGTSSINTTAYRPGSESFGMFTCVWETAAEANTTQNIGLIDSDNGFAIGYNGTAFGVLRRKDTVDTQVALADFNGDDISWLDTTKLNIFMIRYGWLGIAPINFYAYKGATREWVLMHSMDLTNSQTLPSISTPTLPIRIHAERTSGTGADLIMRTASWRGGIVDGGGDFHRHFSAVNSKSAVTTALTSIFTIRSKTTYQAVNNRVTAELELISAASDGTKNVEISVWRNATLGGSPSYADEDTNNSVMEVDTAGTTVTGGKLVFATFLSKVDSEVVNLLPFKYMIHPGETLTFAANTTSGTSDVSYAANWGEIF